MAYPLWREAVQAGATLDLRDQKRITPFIGTGFGTPATPKPDSHVCGWVAEFLWYCISAEERHREGRSLARLEGPGLHATEPGGDGLAIWRKEHGGELSFCLWEIKNSVGSAAVSATVKRAYDQLGDRATEYLAKMTAIAASLDYDPQMQQLYAGLVDLWVDDDEQSAAGIAVGTHSAKAPQQCFSTMHQYFPGKRRDWQLEGLVVAISDFESFSEEVRANVWSVL
ncbi:hypothetical protein [Actinomycetospora cinnamomea]|uniref:hypothetical protein n=1 Tax=Actinomycetospora cinnamomea TaxID=663609 RepID=UPI0014038B1A|nr:hypothetical protein [Actinomycetospora cinnamomea]